MANEIKVSATLKVEKGSSKFERSLNSQSFTQTGTNATGGVINVGTTHEALPVTDVGTPGWCWFRNLDSTNYVEIGVDTTGTFRNVVKLKAGEFCVVRLATTAPYARANTAAVDLEYHIAED